MCRDVSVTFVCPAAYANLEQHHVQPWYIDHVIKQLQNSQDIQRLSSAPQQGQRVGTRREVARMVQKSNSKLFSQQQNALKAQRVCDSTLTVCHKENSKTRSNY